MTRRSRYIAYAFAALTPLVAMVPLVRVASDWMTMSRMTQAFSFEPVDRGYDWVEWQEQDGLIRARYLHPRGPAAQVGLQSGDVFHQLDFQQYFNVEDLRQAIEGVPPGSQAVYTVMRGDELLQVAVTFSHDPTFLYPHSGSLWKFALWGFALGAFLHILGLRIVAPLSLRSRKARFSLVLIAVSSLWIIGTLLRLVMIELTGPPLVPGSAADVAFNVLTLVGLAGLLAFPAMLLHKVMLDARLLRRGRPGIAVVFLYLPALVLAVAAGVAVVSGAVGPLTLDSLATSILFYACTYIAAASGLMFVLYVTRPERIEDVLGRWNRAGSIVTLVVSVVAALAVLTVVLMIPPVPDVVAGWLIVSAQLLAVAPVVLVSHATLQHGKVDLVVSRGIVYLALLGLFFFAFVGGIALIEPYVADAGAARNVVAGLYGIALLLLFGWLGRGVDAYASTILTSDRRRTRRVFNSFASEMRRYVDATTLARESARTLSIGLDVRTVAVFLRPMSPGGSYTSGIRNPEPPYITQRFVSLVWPHLGHDDAIWSRNVELADGDVPEEIVRLLHSRHVSLVVPIRDDQGLAGLIFLGEKRQRRGVYNLEDVELLRSFASQLALAVERLALVERGKALVRETAQAHLVALRAQINPHFLFNALNTIAALIAEQPREAEKTVEAVSTIFRHTLQAGDRPFVKLSEELDLVTQYLSIEKARFGERLSFEIDADPRLVSHPVPAFCVQTLVENAVKHGLERQRGNGRIEIRCSSRRDHVVLEVDDNGVGIADLFGNGESTSFHGVGLKNVSARLEMLYGGAGSLRIKSASGIGTTATITLPLVVETMDPVTATVSKTTPQADIPDIVSTSL